MEELRPGATSDAPGADDVEPHRKDDYGRWLSNLVASPVVPPSRLGVGVPGGGLRISEARAGVQRALTRFIKPREADADNHCVARQSERGVQQHVNEGSRSGHTLTLSTTRAEVWVYEKARAYGHWILWQSPAGDELCASHSLPTRCGPDGGFLDLQCVDRHQRPIDAWRRDPVGCLAPLFGDAIADDVAPKVRLALIDSESIPFDDDSY